MLVACHMAKAHCTRWKHLCWTTSHNHMYKWDATYYIAYDKCYKILVIWMLRTNTMISCSRLEQQKKNAKESKKKKFLKNWIYVQRIPPNKKKYIVLARPVIIYEIAYYEFIKDVNVVLYIIICFHKYAIF